jgi:ABC-type multidrug transport system permease subunit
MNSFWQLFLTRLREFYREPEVIFWVYGFPLLLAVGLGIAFSNRQPEPAIVDIQQTDDEARDKELAKHLETAGLVVEIHNSEDCERRRLTGRTMLYIVPTTEGYKYRYDETQPESRTAYFQVSDAINRWRAGSAINWVTEKDSEAKPGNRYIDFVLPGLIGMNLMGGGLWGVGFVIVDMRVRKLLKRLLATPMRRSSFLLAILSARMTLMLPEMALLVLAGRLIFDVPIRGSFLTLGLVILVGASAFSGIGLLLACRSDKTETISGLMNLVMLPMWLLSGVFFSSKRFPEAVQPFIQALPLTQLNNALREVMLDGASLWEVGWRLLILAGFAVVCFTLALRWFKWQ